MRSWLLTLVLCAGCASSESEDQDLRPVAKRMVAEADRWKPGDRIPPHMLELREPGEDGYCVGLVTDTAPILEAITNYRLLLRLIPLVDGRLLEFVFDRAARLAGPTRLFHDLSSPNLVDRHLFGRPDHLAILHELSEPHALVVGLFIRHKDMTEDERKTVLAGIADDLKRGESWDAVYDRHFRRHEYVENEGINKGSTLTKIGNYGDFVISPSRRSARPFRSTSVAEDHVAPLLAAKKGDVLILDDEEEEWTLLYKVLDSYAPPK